MVLTQGQIKHFCKRLEDEKQKKISTINATFPVTNIDYTKMLKEGKGKLRADKELRAAILKRNRAWPEKLYNHEIWNFDKDTEAIEKVNEINRQRREDLYLLLDEQIEKLTDEAYIGDAGALLGMLENFRKMTFGVKG